MKLIQLVIVLSFYINTSFAQNASNLELKPISDEALKSVSQFFQYDTELPLDVQIIDSTAQTNYIKLKFVFTGVANERVPGILAIPKNGNGPFPCVLGLSGGNGEKEVWFDPSSDWPEPLMTQELINNGYAIMALDGVNAGERQILNDFQSPMTILFGNHGFNQIRDIWVQTVVEHRRAIDFLATRPEIDIDKLGITSSSGGSIKSWILLAFEPRLKVGVPLVTPLAVWDSKYWGVDEKRLDGITVLAPWNYAPAINKPVLILMGNQDDFYTKTQVEELHRLLKSKEKDLIWYDKGHNLESDYVPDALNWFKKYLK